MISSEELVQFKAFALRDGAYMGVLWVVSFACFVCSQSQPFMSLAFDLSIVMIPYLAFFFVRHYRDDILGGFISFRRAWAYVARVFLYATLILAITQWAYFQFIDGGALVTGMINTVNSDEFAPVLEAYKMSRKELIDQLQLISEARPIDFAFTFIWLNVFAGLIIGWIVALFTKRTKK